jgi:hypothetical protein
LENQKNERPFCFCRPYDAHKAKELGLCCGLKQSGGHVHPIPFMKCSSALQSSHLIAVNEVDEEPDFADEMGSMGRVRTKAELFSYSPEAGSQQPVNGTHQPPLEPFTLFLGSVVPQAVSRWLPTVATRVRIRAACAVCGVQSGTGAGFLRVLRFPLPIIITPISPSS